MTKSRHLTVAAPAAAFVVLITTVVHGFNMFDFPYHLDDEGAYMAYAWAVAERGDLSHYTYWYDHAPAGWLLIAAWSLLIGGFETFGTAVDSGRVLMLIVHVVTVLATFTLARSSTKSTATATVAALLVALSPFAVYWSRRVLLDNMASMWILLALIPLFARRITLTGVWLSALGFGVAALTKLSVLPLAPMFLALLVLRTHGSLRTFAVAGWPAVAVSAVSSYVLMAALRGELFPSGTLLGGSGEHVSLVEGVAFQMTRYRDAGIFDPSSRFWVHAHEWISAEPLLTIGGTTAALASLVWLRRRPLVAITGVGTLSMWLFLGRGGQVLSWYIIPLLPLLALNLALAAEQLAQLGRRWLWLRARAVRAVSLASSGVVLALLLALTPRQHSLFAGPTSNLWTADQASAQRQAVAWIQTHVRGDSVIVMDNIGWTRLRDPQPGENEYRDVHWYWKVDLDPEVADDVLGRDWRNIDYVVATWGMEGDARADDLRMVLAALHNSTGVARFDGGGWPVEIRRVGGDRPRGRSGVNAALAPR